MLRAQELVYNNNINNNTDQPITRTHELNMLIALAFKGEIKLGYLNTGRVKNSRKRAVSDAKAGKTPGGINGGKDKAMASVVIAVQVGHEMVFDELGARYEGQPSFGNAAEPLEGLDGKALEYFKDEFIRNPLGLGFIDLRILGIWILICR